MGPGGPMGMGPGNAYNQGDRENEFRPLIEWTNLFYLHDLINF